MLTIYCIKNVKSLDTGVRGGGWQAGVTTGRPGINKPGAARYQLMFINHLGGQTYLTSDGHGPLGGVKSRRITKLWIFYTQEQQISTGHTFTGRHIHYGNYRQTTNTLPPK